MKIIASYALLTGTIIGLLPQIAVASDFESAVIRADFKMGNRRPDPEFPAPLNMHHAPIVLTAKLNKPRQKALDGTVGSCAVVFKDVKYSSGEIIRENSASLDPGEIARHLFKHRYETDSKGVDLFESMTVHEESDDGNKTSILERPKHGTLIKFVDKLGVDRRGQPYATSYSKNNYEYVPAKGFTGTDRVSFITELAGHRIKSVTYIKVTNLSVTVDSAQKILKSYCPNYSQLLSQKCGSDDLPAWQRAANLSALIASAQQTLTGFADLPSTAVGETTGRGPTAQITLDTTAAGHGWYIDPTPLNNSDDYLPTSDASVWQAKAGSAAAGKMDMLSVLLHEYGHALGLEHSGNGADFMAASLQPGVRKLPSSEELALMGQLVAQMKAEQGAALTPALSQGERGQGPLNPFGHA